MAGGVVQQSLCVNSRDARHNTLLGALKARRTRSARRNSNQKTRCVLILYVLRSLPSVETQVQDMVMC